MNAQGQAEPGKRKANQEASCGHLGLRSKRPGLRSATEDEEKMQDREMMKASAVLGD